MKIPTGGFWLPALLVAASLLASCGGAGGGEGGDDGRQSMGHGGSRGGETSRQETQQETTSGSSTGTGHDRMENGSMGVGSEGMVMENGQYSDKRFIDMMVPHHRGAIEMARVALKNAEHKEIKELSQNILATQQAEIEELESIKQEEFGTSRVPMEMNSRQMRGMGMMDPQQLANQEPFDKAFIDAMIPHHESAIEMASCADQGDSRSHRGSPGGGDSTDAGLAAGVVPGGLETFTKQR